LILKEPIPDTKKTILAKDLQKETIAMTLTYSISNFVYSITSKFDEIKGLTTRSLSENKHLPHFLKFPSEAKYYAVDEVKEFPAN
jgi:hypothetical protein